MSAPTVLVPLEGSSDVTPALPVARGLAALKNATVVLMHVGREPLAPDEFLARGRLDRDDVRGLVIDHRVGSPVEAIIREAAIRHSELIVLAVQTRADDPSAPFGRVAKEVLRTAPCPVVLVPSTRGRDPWALRQLVLPHDGTPTSAAAIAPAVQIAAQTSADFVVLHVATPDGRRPQEPGTFMIPRYFDQPQHEWPAWAREFLERVRCLGHPANVETIRLVLAHGEADAAILAFARHNASDLIALAWRGRFGAKRARTMRRVVRGANCPVIVFRVPA